MTKFLHISLFLVLVLSLNSQTDSLTKKPKNINHLISLDFGYTPNQDHLIGNKGDVGLSYLFNYKGLMAKLKYGITPNSNFGTLKKAFLNFGYSTKIDGKFSWYILGGLGLTQGEKVYHYNVINFVADYRYGSYTPIIESGILLNILHQNKFYTGINGSCFVEKITKIGSHSIQSGLIVANININFLFKF